ncbi:TetR/AcrR family transcriptional regulator [Nocardia sp. NPDC057353]|uniref:TetR/AcrR family transcriptional regulator n=1 Tax=Nocardia sp. NPDC057353 TaxID=3346104 RepID=UPI00363752E7
MAGHGEAARGALMDAAEELYGRDGIDQVSNRRIAERAGNANHSAVAYHFGDRDGLITAMLDRYTARAEPLRARLLAALDPDPALPALLHCLVLPAVRGLVDLPAPSWRARFVNQVRAAPSTAPLLERPVAGAASAAIMAAVRDRLCHVDPAVLDGRGWVLTRMVFEVCAAYEAELAAGQREPEPAALACFLTDAAAGMLAAPVTAPGGFAPDPTLIRI